MSNSRPIQGLTPAPMSAAHPRSSGSNTQQRPEVPSTEPIPSRPTYVVNAQGERVYQVTEEEMQRLYQTQPTPSRSTGGHDQDLTTAPVTGATMVAPTSDRAAVSPQKGRSPSLGQGNTNVGAMSARGRSQETGLGDQSGRSAGSSNNDPNQGRATQGRGGSISSAGTDRGNTPTNAAHDLDRGTGTDYDLMGIGEGEQGRPVDPVAAALREA